MNVLILGGTKFLGRALVDAALAAGHAVTLFNRGQTNPDLYPEVERLRGNRDGDLTALAGRTWDAAIDTCGYVPRIVGDSARLLAESVEHYTFVSSISVYADSVHAIPHTDESHPIATLDDETVEDIAGGTYGGLKALCEKAAEAAMPGRVLSVRSGLLVGPYDLSDRFTYWPVMLSRGGEVLVPPASAPLQIIDVRDTARWILRMAEQRKAGVYNVTGPDDALTFGRMLRTCREVIGNGAAEMIVADNDFLVRHDVVPWMNLPLWLPTGSDGLQQISINRALKDGLTFTPLETTVRDTLDWFAAHRAATPNLTGELLSAERHAALIAAWKARAG